MQIPAVFAVEMGEDAIGAVSVPEGRCLPETGDRVIPFADAAASIPRGETREPAVVVDWDSIRARGFREAVLKALGEGSFLKEGAIFLSIAVFLMSILLSFSLAKLRKRTVLGLPVFLALDFLLFALSYLFEREGGFLTPLAYFLGLVYHLARLVFALIFYLNYARVFRLSGSKHGKS